MPNNHGGPRPGSGRPKGSGKGRTVITRSVSMPPDIWDRLDTVRGEQSRGEWIAERVRRTKD